MKRKRLCFLLAVFLACASSSFSQVMLNEANFPDDNFRAALSGILGVAEGAEISEEMIKNTKKLGEDGKLNDKDFSADGIKGIEHFTSLEYLRIYNGKLKSVDLSSNINLTYLYLGTNNLEELNISALTELKYLNCEKNKIVKLDITENKKLEELQCQENPTLKELIGLGEQTNLNFLWCFTCNFTSKKLDLSKFNNLTEVKCSNLALTELKLPNGDGNKLNILECSRNNLTSLDISKNTNLVKLICTDNKSLTELNTTNNLNLEELRISDTSVKNIDLTKNEKLKVLYCYSNGMTALDVSNNIALTEIKCHNNKIPELNLTNNTALKILFCGTNLLTNLDVSKNILLTELECQSNNLGKISVECNTSLNRLVCTSTGISTLDVSKQKGLIWLDCDQNALTSLDVSNNIKLTHLSCFSNKISLLDVTKLTDLKDLKCSHNQLTSLDLNNNSLSTACEIANQSLTQVVEVVDGKNIGIPVASGMKKENVSNLKIDTTPITDFDVQMVGDKTYLVIYKTPGTDMDFCDANKVVRYDYISGYSDRNMDVTIHTGPYVMRIPTKEGYGTLCIDYDSKIPANTTCYYATEIKGDNDTMNLMLTKITGGYVPANTPILVKSQTTETSDPNVVGEMYAFYEAEENATIPTISGNILAGNASGSVSVQPKDVLTLGYGDKYGQLGFWRYTGSSVAAHRAYVPAEQVPSNAKGLLFVFDNGNAGGDVTAVPGIPAGDITGKDAVYYTLQGMKLGTRPSRKGVYIVNGRKVVVK